MSNYFLVFGSGMFYDGNHTYLIEPEENEKSQVSAPFAVQMLVLVQRPLFVFSSLSTLFIVLYC
jgi:hypothetical protein